MVAKLRPVFYLVCCSDSSVLWLFTLSGFIKVFVFVRFIEVVVFFIIIPFLNSSFFVFGSTLN